VLAVPTAEWSALRPWFQPERPGPLVFEHVLTSGRGRCLADRWPEPRAVLAETAENYTLRGDPGALTDADIDAITGLVEAPPEWLPRLRNSDPGLGVWQRVVAALPADAVAAPSAPRKAHRAGTAVRKLTPADAAALAALPEDIAWIHESWGGVEPVLAAGVAHGAVVDGEIVSVAVAFFQGRAYEDIGVVTAKGYRRAGLSAACAAAVVADIRARGRVPSWTTSPDNTGSLAVAAQLGFVHDRDDVLYAVRTPIPG
jgi:RimJ/RimL family protein N-acetyltransferase